MFFLFKPAGGGDVSKDGRYPGDRLSQPKRGIQTYPDGRHKFFLFEKVLALKIKCFLLNFITGTVTGIPAGMLNDQFGMVGLLACLRAIETDPSIIPLALGHDLTTLGLNLNAPE